MTEISMLVKEERRKQESFIRKETMNEGLEKRVEYRNGVKHG